VRYNIVMTPFLQLALALAILVAAAKAGGYLSYQLGQPSVLGELMAGLILGPTVLNILHIPYFTDEHLPEVIHEIAEVGVLLLMFLAGLELHLTDLAKSGKISVLGGVLGVVFPLTLGAGVGLAFSMETTSAIFVGLILSATSVSISAQTLMELKELRSRVGISLLGAAVFDDILIILSLSIFSAFVFAGEQSGMMGVLGILVRMVAFLGIGTGVGLVVLPSASGRVSRLPISQGLIAFVIVTILLYGWTAEVLGNMAAITGAFLAGLMFARSPVKERIESGINALAFGLFVPVFFIDVGLKANLRDLTGETLWIFLAMILVAIVGKVAGSGLGGLLGGMSRSEALQLGIGMMSRGEVGLIVASVGIASGAIPQDTFSAVVGVVIITTLLTPPLLRWSFRRSKDSVGKGGPTETQKAQPERGGESA
jgi:Kef-type K+ transport system membrane component KefB